MLKQRGLVESSGGIILRPSHLELYVKLSPYTAPEYGVKVAKAHFAAMLPL